MKSLKQIIGGIMMVIKKTETEKELTEALKNNQILKQEIESLKKLLETFQENKNEMVLKYEKRIKEQKDIVDMLRTNLSDANNHIVKLGEQRHEKNHELQRYKEFSATLENDVKMMSKAIVKIMMGVERDG